MDIKALLSPQERPSNQQSGGRSGSTPNRKRTRTGSLKDHTLIQQAHAVTAQRPAYNFSGAKSLLQPSPTTTQRTQYANIPNGTYEFQTQRPSAPRSYSDPHSYKMRAQPTSSPKATRHGNASMDTLADLATMQQYAARPTVNGSRGPALQSPHRSPTLSNLQYRVDGAFENGNVPLTPSGSRTASMTADHPMSDAPTPTLPPADFESHYLTTEESQEITKLTQQISESSFAFDTHVQLITLLRKGFTSHITPRKTSDPLPDPSHYGLVQELRQARDAMLSRFPVGEQLWLEWLEDECMVSKTVEDRAAVIELFKKAVQEEVGSTRLWRFYGHWMWYLYKMSYDIPASITDSPTDTAGLLGRILASQNWSEEDQMVGQELFGWDAMMKVWDEGVQATQWNLDSSHLVWDPRMEILMMDLTSKHSAEKYSTIQRLYTDRTRQPHLKWDETFSAFSQFVSKYESDGEYEKVMAFTTEKAGKAKHELALRQDREFQLQRAAEMGDHTSQYQILADYLEWESQQDRRKNAPHFGLDLHRALLERANLLFSSDASLWEDHLDLVMEKKQLSYAILPLAHRATRHCPWSGELWSRYLYILEAHLRPYSEVENVKHHATSTGLLEELGGMDELIKVFTAWCGILRRQAFRPGAREDDQDVAHVGIRSALEDVRSIGERKYGREFKGDPLYRLERIYFKFLSQIGAVDEARKMYDGLVATHGDQYEFWDRYYLFEMTSWGKEFGRTASKPSDLLRPEYATRVLQRAMKRTNLDWPEKMIEAYLHHCGQHESVEKLQEALVEARRATKQVKGRRAREQAEQIALQEQSHLQLQQDTAHDDTVVSTEGPTEELGLGKRKADESNVEPESEQQPKRRNVDNRSSEKPETGDASSTTTSLLKRDRENTLVTVSSLPKDCKEDRLRRFFRDCGEIMSVNLTKSSDGSSASATVEFKTTEDVLTACTKDKKQLDGATIEVHAGTGTTLWVTNYPAEADEEFIRTLFKSYGDIVEVRFPSLHYNTKRRFCYVQFLTGDQAQAATELDGMPTEHELKLIVKISNPSIREDRDASSVADRELFVGNLDFSATESSVQEVFEKYGTIERIRVPRIKDSDRIKGVAFIVFSTKDEAAAAAEMHQKMFKGRPLRVNLSDTEKKPDNHKKFTATILNKAGSPAVESTAGSPMSGVEVESLGSAQQNTQQPKAHFKERSIALMHVPDTVNDARIRAIAETYGPLDRIMLRPDHQGAIVDYDSVADAGKASLGLQDFEIIPGRRIKVGTVPQMMKLKPEKKAAAQDKLTAMAPPSTVVRRPGQGNARRGGRGGLGYKKDARGGAGTEDKVVRDENEEQEQEQEQEKNSRQGPKTQDDFRAMLKKD